MYNNNSNNNGSHEAAAYQPHNPRTYNQDDQQQQQNTTRSMSSNSAPSTPSGAYYNRQAAAGTAANQSTNRPNANHYSSNQTTSGGKDVNSHINKIFIGGLSPETTKEDVEEYFSKYGEIQDAVVMTDANTGRSRGFGFVKFASLEQVDEVQRNRDHTIKDKLVETKRATPKGFGVDQNSMHSKKVFVGGVPNDCTKEMIQKYAEENFGAVEDVYLNTQNTRYYAFITFTDYDAADKMILQGNHRINNQEVTVNRAQLKNGRQQRQNNYVNHQQPMNYHPSNYQLQQEDRSYNAPRDQVFRPQYRMENGVNYENASYGVSNNDARYIGGYGSYPSNSPQRSNYGYQGPSHQQSNQGYANRPNYGNSPDYSQYNGPNQAPHQSYNRAHANSKYNTQSNKAYAPNYAQYPHSSSYGGNKAMKSSYYANSQYGGPNNMQSNSMPSSYANSQQMPKMSGHQHSY